MKRRFGRLAGGLRIGADFFERAGALDVEGPAPRGVVDRLADLANPAIDVTRVHPSIAVFFEDTASLELTIRSRWRFPFSIAWWLARPVMRWLGQLVLPLREGRVLTRVLGLDRARDGRDDARAVIREYAEGGVMQVVAYATSEHAGVRLMNASFPLPFGHLTGLLRLDAIGEDDKGRLAVALTSASRDGDGAGIWFVVRGVGLPLPLGERLSLWAPSMSSAPRDLAPEVGVDALIVGRHEQRLLGVRVVTHDYGFRRLPDRAPPART